MDRRTFVAAAGASMTAAALGGLSLALQACAPRRFPWPGETQAWTAEQIGVLSSQCIQPQAFVPPVQFFHNDKLYSLSDVEVVNGETFETWMTPNGYVNIVIGNHLNDPDLIQYKHADIVYFDEHFLGPKAASALPA